MKLGKKLKTMTAAVVLAVMTGGLAADPSWAATLVEIVDNQEEDELRQWLAMWGSQIRNTSINGDPVLILAVNRQWLQGVRMLLSAGCDVNAPGNGGRTALLAAAEMGNPEILGLLLDRNANVNARDRDGCTALMYAIGRGNREIINMLMSARYADLTIRAAGGPYAGQDALTIAVRRGDEETVDGLLRDVRVIATINSRDRAEMSAFAYALESGNERMVEAFLCTGRIDLHRPIGTTRLPPLLWAISSRVSASIIEQLIFAIANDPEVEINDIVDQRGRNAWYYATLTNNRAVLRMLDDAGAGKNE